MDILETRNIPIASGQAILEDRAADAATNLPAIKGYTAVFGVDTQINTWAGSYNERIQKGAFKRAIREGQDVRALRNHEPDNLLGRTVAKTLRLKEDDTGLMIDVDTPNTTIGRDTVESIRRGDLSGMSFAFIVRKEKWINGDNGEPLTRIIQDVDLFDVGPVTYPAYTQTSADLRSASEVLKRGLEECQMEVPEALLTALAEKKAAEEKKTPTDETPKEQTEERSEEPLPEGIIGVDAGQVERSAALLIKQKEARLQDKVLQGKIDLLKLY